MKNSNFFIQSLLPNIPRLTNIKNITKSTALTSDNTPIPVKVSAPLKTALIDTENKSVLVILDDQTNEQSLQLLEKIMLSMHISKEQITYLKTWDQSLTQESLTASLSQSKVKIIFLIGSIASQHFLGKDKKISQIQGQIFDYSYQDQLYHFVSLYHPDFIALNASIKTITWNSIKTLIPWIKQQLASD